MVYTKFKYYYNIYLILLPQSKYIQLRCFNNLFNYLTLHLLIVRSCGTVKRDKLHHRRTIMYILALVNMELGDDGVGRTLNYK